ncbi:MAG: hypothetical protein ACM3SM_06735 [Bacteroidota bacterium]
MGQQQLLLVIVGVIIVGIAVITGINLFMSNAVDQKRNNIISDCIHLAAEAQQYYMRPLELGGGSERFTGWAIPTTLRTNQNGRFIATVYADSVVISAVGNEVVTGNDSVEVEIAVLPKSYNVRIIH